MFQHFKLFILFYRCSKIVNWQQTLVLCQSIYAILINFRTGTMRKYILALGCYIVLCNQTICAQEYIKGNTYYDNNGKAYFYDENGKAFYYPEPVAVEDISDNTKSADNNNVEDNKSDIASDNTTISHTVSKDILADEELMKTITPEQLERYISRGADVNIKFIRKTKDEQDENKIIETKDVTPLMMAALGNSDVKVIELLLKKGADIQAKNENEKTAFMYAAEENSNPEVIETLLKNGANIEAKAKYGLTALICAAYRNKNPEVIETLIKNGANIEAKNKYGLTALMYAAYGNKNPEVIETLIENGANIEAKDKDGTTALMFAAYRNKNPEVIETLIENGANIEAKDKDGTTALMLAMNKEENPDAAEVLIAYGANTDFLAERNIRNIGNQMLISAFTGNNPDIIRKMTGQDPSTLGIGKNKRYTSLAGSIVVGFTPEGVLIKRDCSEAGRVAQMFNGITDNVDYSGNVQEKCEQNWMFVYTDEKN